MRESGVGRVLVASLHQAIGDVMPTRLGFYENWLTPEGLREGTIGLAPLYAVLSFLRQEGTHYDGVVRTAGRYAAEWTVESMSPTRRRFVARLPRFVRRRMVLGRARRLVRESFVGNRASWRIRKGTARFEVTGSVFCEVREPVATPLCGYYAAACARMLALFDLDVPVDIASCRGTVTGATRCTLTVPFSAPVAEPSLETEHA